MLAPNGNKKTKPRVNGITGIETRRTSSLAQQLSYKYYTLQRHHRDRQKKKDTKISPTTAVVFRRGGADLPGQPNVLQGRMRRLNLANFCRLGLAVKTETGAGGGGRMKRKRPRSGTSSRGRQHLVVFTTSPCLEKTDESVQPPHRHTYLVEKSKVRQVLLPQQVFLHCKRFQLGGSALRGCASTSTPRTAHTCGGSAGGTSLAEYMQTLHT